MAQLNPYLNFNGKTEEAFNFYKSIFGGEFQTFMRYSDIPPGVPTPQSEKENKKIMHVSLPIGGGTILMGSDNPEILPPVTMGNNFHISVDVGSEEEAKKIFNGLSQGGKISMPLDKTFWGAYFGMFSDKYGVNWMVNYTYSQN